MSSSSMGSKLHPRVLSLLLSAIAAFTTERFSMAASCARTHPGSQSRENTKSRPIGKGLSRKMARFLLWTVEMANHEVPEPIHP